MLVATLDRPFMLVVHEVRCLTPFAAFLATPDVDMDRADAERIKRTISGLVNHWERHRALCHRFDFSLMDVSEACLPVIPKSYHKINTGPFLRTPFGPCLLRQSEIEHLHGCKLPTDPYAAAVAILRLLLITGRNGRKVGSDTVEFSASMRAT
jgi:hypothetical protein